MQEVQVIKFSDIASNGGSKHKFKLRNECKFVRNVLFVYDVTVVTDPDVIYPFPADIITVQLGRASLLQNNKNDLLLLDYPIIADVDIDGTESRDKSNYIKSELIPLNKQIEKNSYHQFVFKKSDALRSDWTVNITILFFYDKN